MAKSRCVAAAMAASVALWLASGAGYQWLQRGPRSARAQQGAPCLPRPSKQRGQGDKKAAAERMRQEVRAAIEEDKAQARGGGELGDAARVCWCCVLPGGGGFLRQPRSLLRFWEHAVPRSAAV